MPKRVDGRQKPTFIRVVGTARGQKHLNHSVPQGKHAGPKPGQLGRHHGLDALQVHRRGGGLVVHQQVAFIRTHVQTDRVQPQHHRVVQDTRVVQVYRHRTLPQTGLLLQVHQREPVHTLQRHHLERVVVLHLQVLRDGRLDPDHHHHGR